MRHRAVLPDGFKADKLTTEVSVCWRSFVRRLYGMHDTWMCTLVGVGVCLRGRGCMRDAQRSVRVSLIVIFDKNSQQRYEALL